MARLEICRVCLDAGTFGSLIDASIFMQVIEKRHRFKVSSLQEIAWRNGWIIDQEAPLMRADSYESSLSGAYPNSLLIS
jgi:glucose-1-phosphate thymidylyltransferase